MTIVTKPLNEKKAAENPFVGVNIQSERTQGHGVPLMDTNNFNTLVRQRRVQSASTTCLFLTALMVLSCGIVTGLYLYKQFVRVQMERFHMRCSIPFSPEREDQMLQDIQSNIMMQPENLIVKENKYFHEDFEIDDNYEKITVPDFSGGRRSKFIHDFKVNKTGIIDVNGHRCFVMPLNRTLVLPPETLMDLVKKMHEGYYEVDTGYVRDSMQVVTPAIEDRSSLGHYIEQECFGFPIYMLKKIESGVFKRSAEPEIKFTEFAGKNTHELFIVNYKELEEHEPVAMA